MDKSRPKIKTVISELWDTYKYLIIICAVIAAALLYMLFKAISTDSPDLRILVAGESYMDEDSAALASDICSGLTNDLNGDGKTVVEFLQLTAQQKLTQDGEFMYESGMMTRFNTEVNTCSSLSYIVDEAYYKLLCENSMLAPLSSIFNDIPDGAFDDYGFLYGALSLSTLDGFDKLKPDSYICFRRMPLENEIQYVDTETYQAALELFKSLVTLPAE